MTSKEFDLIISMILELLKNGQVDSVISLLEEAKSQNGYEQKNLNRSLSEALSKQGIC